MKANVHVTLQSRKGALCTEGLVLNNFTIIVKTQFKNNKKVATELLRQSIMYTLKTLFYFAKVNNIFNLISDIKQRISYLFIIISYKRTHSSNPV